MGELTFDEAFAELLANPTPESYAFCRSLVEKKKITPLQYTLPISDKLIVPATSVFNTHRPAWKKLEKKWSQVKLDGLLGRDTGLIGDATGVLLADWYKGTSVFSPALAEVIYTLFPVESVYDPFCGGITRGQVAYELGIDYTGVDLSQRQIDFNSSYNPEITWVHGDSSTLPLTKDYDMLFTCPPYYNLEQYSDHPNDLSNAPTYEDFLQLLDNAFELITPHIKSHIVIIVGDIRNERGFYYGLPDDIIRLLAKYNWFLYNRAVLYSMGSASIRSRRTYFGSAKLVKTHQDCLHFLVDKHS